jgi:hypothetical protein
MEDDEQATAVRAAIETAAKRDWITETSGRKRCGGTARSRSGLYNAHATRLGDAGSVV